VALCRQDDIPASCRARGTLQYSYTRDPDYGDEAYDLRTDPLELDNLLNPGRGPAAPLVEHLRRRVDEWEAHCLELRQRLGVIPGPRGFNEGWE
jgi:hypothetical protein